jgi:hypothetical protein
MEHEYTGGCLCGSFRFRFSGDAAFSINCHCRDCQRATGGCFASVFAIPKVRLTMEGDYHFHTMRGGSGGEISRGFCPHCGSRAVSKLDKFPDHYLVYGVSLDDPTWHKPTVDIWTSSAQAWDCMDPLLPKFEKGIVRSPG